MLEYLSPLESAAMSEPMYLAKSEDGYPALLPQMANRHGLITGATGTGKTVTLQSMAERLSFAGVPVFMADVKGDLTGITQAGKVSDKLAAVLGQPVIIDNKLGAVDVPACLAEPGRERHARGPCAQARETHLSAGRAGR